MYVRLSRGILLVAAMLATTGCAVRGPHLLPPTAHNAPPAQRMLEPGPGVGGPGPGVMMPMAMPMPTVAQAQFQAPGQMPRRPGMPTAPTVQVQFSQPEGMQVRWDVNSIGGFDSDPMIVPGRHNFPQGGIFRLKLTNVPGRVGVELYPTLEVGPTTARTGAFLAHNTIPISFSEEDFDQVLSGNFVTKVIYLPDPEFQELALADVGILVSTRLDPGVDPVVEADRRGAIMAIIRLGNKDFGLPGTNGDAAGAIPLGAQRGVPGGPAAPAGMMPPPYVAGVTAPQYGMPMTGTPIGLPGPPHIPLGGPAGLQKHVMHNHTQRLIPHPTDSLRFHVRQSPGMTYPRPADRVYVNERVNTPSRYSVHPRYEQQFINGGR